MKRLESRTVRNREDAWEGKGMKNDYIRKDKDDERGCGMRKKK